MPTFTDTLWMIGHEQQSDIRRFVDRNINPSGVSYTNTAVIHEVVDLLTVRSIVKVNPNDVTQIIQQEQGGEGETSAIIGFSPTGYS